MLDALTYADIANLSAAELNQFDSFRYEALDGATFTVRRESRKTTDNTYWTAYKRKFGRLRKMYIGDSHELFGDKLEDVANRLNSPDSEFWSNRPGHGEVTQQDTQELNRIGELTEQLNATKKELYELTKALIEVKDRNSYLERELGQQKTPPVEINPEAIAILEQALILKANAGGAIKTAIREALELLKLPNKLGNT